MGTIIYTRGISGHLEGKCVGRPGRRITGIWDDGGVLDRHKEGVWQ